MRKPIFWLWIVGAFVVLLSLNRRLSDQVAEAQKLSNATTMENADLAEQLAKCKAGK